MPISGKLYMWGERAKYIPDEAGVYAFYNKDRLPVYIGGSANLQETFSHCLETNFSDDPRKHEIRYYKREFNPNWKERVRALLDEYSQEYGGLPKLNIPLNLPKKEVPREEGFYFYEKTDKPLSKAAFSMGDFWEKIGELPVASLEFHQRKGDFAKWIDDIFEETQLAERIKKISNTGEGLRREILNTLLNPEKAECPECGAQIDPLKSWKMAGRPSKTGERLQLTIGFYKCGNCEETFRKVLRKKKIAA
jgi:hypothetical protein